MPVSEISEVFASPFFGTSVTLGAYVISQAIYRRWQIVHPLIPTCGLLIALLWIGRIPYPAYLNGGGLIAFFLGPATVALGVPLYKQASQIRANVGVLVGSIAVGSVAGMVSAGLLVWMCRGSRVLILSMIPKSVTTPISMAISEQLGGQPALTAVYTAVAGLIGSIIGPRLLKMIGVRNDLAVGAAMGTSSHGIGTARVLRDSELQGGASGLAMALAGIITSLLSLIVVWWLRRH